MTQNSIPQQGHLSDNVSPDAGPYSAFQWSEIWRQLFTNSPDQGPVGLTGDSTLQATNPSGTTIEVAAGRSMVAGHFFNNTATVTMSATPPVSDSRIDVVVVVHNESITPVTSGIASGNSLIFPSDLTDYQGTASIPPYSTRIAILQGTPSATPVAPVLDQDPSLLAMIPLAEYTIDSGGTISNFTDTRVYAQSSGGGAVYVPNYYQNLTETVYQGRARILVFDLKFAMGNGELTKDISWQGQPDPILGADKYATFPLSSIEDFDLITTFGGGYTVRYSTVSGNPDYMRWQLRRRGFVDDAGVAQPPPTSATDIYATGILIQLLDVPPLPTQ